MTAGNMKKKSDPVPIAKQKSELRTENKIQEFPERERLPKRGKLDEPLLVLTLLLLAVGLICLFSASYSVAYYGQDGDSTYYIVKQGIFAAAGIVAMLAASRFNYHKLHYLAMPVLIFSLVLLASIKIVPSMWVTINNARRWISLGFTTFQPSEISKFAVILSFSSLATIWGPKKMHTFRWGLLPFMLIIGATAGLLYLEPHLSATVIIAMTGLVIIFLGGANIAWFTIGGGAAGAFVFWFIKTHEYAQTRINVWLDPFSDKLNDGWQGVQSLLAIGSGGFWGLGLGQSRQKHLFLPEPANDFIFSVIGEELGFIGAVLIILLFAALIWRGYYIAMHAGDKFGTLLAAGITTQIAVQTVFNLGVVTGLLPITGAALPFFSYGGTSLLIQLGEMGLLLAVSRRMPAPKGG